jgi:hypothetical protein
MLLDGARAWGQASLEQGFGLDRLLFAGDPMFLDEVRGSIFGQAQGALQMPIALRPPNLDGQGLSLPQMEA